VLPGDVPGGKLRTVAELAEQMGADAPARLAVMSGCYDPLHLGHLRALAWARQALAGSGRFLGVLTLADRYIRAKRGAGRPLLDLSERLTLLQAVRYVDFVVPLQAPDCCAALARLRPGLFIKAEADLRRASVRREAEVVQIYGGTLLAHPDDGSLPRASDIIRQVKQSQRCAGAL